MLIRKKGFTLAEVLITIGIIGVVAAVVMPAFISNYTDKVRAKQDWAVQHKLTLATDEMKSLGLIGPYDSTDSFVKVLKKYLKIAQVCQNDNLENCWPTKTITRADGTEINVADLKSGKDFNPVGGWTKRTIGIITADGTPIIMSYKDNCEALDPLKSYLWDSSMKTNATTSCISMIYDVNGKAKPNKSGKDVKLFNASSLGSGFECEENYGVCMMMSNLSYKPLSPEDCEREKGTLGISMCIPVDDYWAGAKKACTEMGGRLPTITEVRQIVPGMCNKSSLGSNEKCKVVNDPFNLAQIADPTYWLDHEGGGHGFTMIFWNKIAKNGVLTTILKNNPTVSARCVK